MEQWKLKDRHVEAQESTCLKIDRIDAIIDMWKLKDQHVLRLIRLALSEPAFNIFVGIVNMLQTNTLKKNSQGTFDYHR